MIDPSHPTSPPVPEGPPISNPGQPAHAGIQVDLTLCLAALHAHVRRTEAGPTLVISAGNAVVRITTDAGAPAVGELILLGRLVAAVLGFQAGCNRFRRRRNHALPAPDPPPSGPSTCRSSPPAVSGK